MDNESQGFDTKLMFDAWKRTIDTQEHFNDICMKIRNFYISVVSALLAFIGLVLGDLDSPYFRAAGLEIHSALPVLLAVILATYLFYFIDRHWYHRLLLGSVKNALAIEEALKDKVPGIMLTHAIGENSPISVKDKGWGNSILYTFGWLFGSDPRVEDEKSIHSDAKIGIFYKSIAWLFIVVTLATASIGGMRFPDSPVGDAKAELFDTTGGQAGTDTAEPGAIEESPVTAD